MSRIFSAIFNQADNIQAKSLNHRLARGELIGSNVANHETPGYLALEYSFEDALQNMANVSEGLPMKVSSEKHIKHAQLDSLGNLRGNIFVRPSESISEDGNSVDVDKEMAQLAENNILYRGVVESINRKLGILRYAISGG